MAYYFQLLGTQYIQVVLATHISRLTSSFSTSATATICINRNNAWSLIEENTVQSRKARGRKTELIEEGTKLD